jgi:hypothetical protein
MSDLRTAAQKMLRDIEDGLPFEHLDDVSAPLLRAALAHPERHLTDEVIADLWHQNGGFHHHFARHIERWLKGGA